MKLRLPSARSFNISDFISFDLRAFALLRIGLAAVILLDLFIRLTDLEAHYSDSGVLPVSALKQYAWNKYFFSLHALSGDWRVMLSIFLLNIICAFSLLVGYKTRIAGIACWLLMCSLQSRNPMITQGGDSLMRMLLFWGMFIPWHRFYSIDGKHDHEKYQAVRYAGLPAFCLMLQVAFVYFFSGLQKTSSEWQEDGTALYYALSFEQVAFSWSRFIYEYPELLKFLSRTVRWVEILAPILYFIPWRNQYFRMAAIIILVLFHMGSNLLLFVGLFALVGIIAQLAFLPERIMNRIDAWIQRLPFSSATEVQRPGSAVYGPAGGQGMMKIIVLSFLIYYVAIFNMGNAPQFRFTVNPSIQFIGDVLRLDQNWGMFAPGVMKDDGWYVLEGRLADSSKIDIYRGGITVSYAKPYSIVSEIKNDRWRKYGEHMMLSRNYWMRPYFCNYTMRVWNEEHPDKQINQLEVVFMMELSEPDYKPSKVTRETLWMCVLEQ